MNFISMSKNLKKTKNKIISKINSIFIEDNIFTVFLINIKFTDKLKWDDFLINITIRKIVWKHSITIDMHGVYMKEWVTNSQTNDQNMKKRTSMLLKILMLHFLCILFATWNLCSFPPQPSRCHLCLVASVMRVTSHFKAFFTFLLFLNFLNLRGFRKLLRLSSTRVSIMLHSNQNGGSMFLDRFN